MSAENAPTTNGDGAEDEHFVDAEGDGAPAPKKKAGKKAATPKKTAPAVSSNALVVRAPATAAEGGEEEERAPRARHNHPGTVARRDIRRVQIGADATKRLLQEVTTERGFREQYLIANPGRKLAMERAAMEIVKDTLQETLLREMSRSVKCTLHRKAKKVTAADFNFARSMAGEDTF